MLSTVDKQKKAVDLLSYLKTVLALGLRLALNEEVGGTCTPQKRASVLTCRRVKGPLEAFYRRLFRVKINSGCTHTACGRAFQ